MIEIEDKFNELTTLMKNNKNQIKEKIYLFLDFDGVINVFLQPGTQQYEKALRENQFEFADRECIKRLNDLCLEYPIEIVISSSWRYSGIEYCRDYLMRYGLSREVTFAGSTSTETIQPRQLDIINYLFGHQDFWGFLILDDIFMPEFKEYAILIDPLKGYDIKTDKLARSLCSRILKF